MARRAGQRGHIEKHRGKYRAIVSAGTDPLTGKRRFLKKTCDTEKQAEVELTKLLNQVDEQRHVRTKILVRQLIEKWFEVEDDEDSTRERYVGLNRKYIDPVFGSMQAAKLDAELLETFYARLRKCRQLCAGKRVGVGHECRPLSSSSIRQIHFILRGAADRGVRWGYLGATPLRLRKLHRPRRPHRILLQPRRRPRSSTKPGSSQRGARCSGSSWSLDVGEVRCARCRGPT
jgi:integrase